GRPSYHQYYFGDYYATNYYQSGIYPYFTFHQSRYGYDPIYSHVAALNLRRDPNWSTQLRQAYIYRRDHVEARPPHTFVQQQKIVQNNTNIVRTSVVNNINNITINNVTNNNVVLAMSIKQITKVQN